MPYMVWLFLFVVAPTLLLWAFAYKTLWKYRWTFVICIVFSLIFGITWDYFVIANDIWYWPEGCCMLPRVWGLPLDEVPFIVFAAAYVVSLTLVIREIYLTHRHHKRRKS